VFIDMVMELRGAAPKFPISFARTCVNRAYRSIRESHLWSFNIFEAAWIVPPTISAGTATVVQGTNTVTVDATAAAVLNVASTTYSLLTQRQFRIGASGIYNILAWDGVSVLTLDRIYGEASLVNSPYSIYQVYYPAPMQDFLRWISVRNLTTPSELGLLMTRAQLDEQDPQRTWAGQVTQVVPWGNDNRGAGTATPSATLGFPLFELWGQPNAGYAYQLYGLRRGVDLALPTDTLPSQISEELVLALAKRYVYEWIEANKDIQPRSAGPDYRFLMQQTMAEYKRLLVQYRRQDREFIDNYFSVLDRDLVSRAAGYYNTLTGYASTGYPLQ
jgi:hypothetical protein